MFCAIGSERIILPFGFERCVSAAEALQWGFVAVLTLLILMLLMATVGRIQVWWLSRRIRNQEKMIDVLADELSTFTRKLPQ